MFFSMPFKIIPKRLMLWMDATLPHVIDFGGGTIELCNCFNLDYSMHVHDKKKVLLYDKDLDYSMHMHDKKMLLRDKEDTKELWMVRWRFLSIRRWIRGLR